MEHGAYFIGSPTALADSGIYRALQEVTKELRIVLEIKFGFFIFLRSATDMVVPFTFLMEPFGELRIFAAWLFLAL